VNQPPRFMRASAPASPAPIARGFAPFAAAGRARVEGAPAAAKPGMISRAVESVRALARGAASSDEAEQVREGLAAPAATPTAPSDRLYDLLMTQRADGTFPRSPVLAAWLGDARTQKLDAALSGTDERLVVTAVVVLLLERDCADRIGEWKPALAKARAWLSKQAASFNASPIVAG
jgi:Ca-activated chloride channel homolog